MEELKKGDVFGLKELMSTQLPGRQEFIKKIKQDYPHTNAALEEFGTFDLNEAEVWIDPIDGTNCFIKGWF